MTQRHSRWIRRFNCPECKRLGGGEQRIARQQRMLCRLSRNDAIDERIEPDVLARQVVDESRVELPSRRLLKAKIAQLPAICLDQFAWHDRQPLQSFLKSPLQDAQKLRWKADRRRWRFGISVGQR